jgi:tetratricopeptide (TPR) repeat protein
MTDQDSSVAQRARLLIDARRPGQAIDMILQSGEAAENSAALEVLVLAYLENEQPQQALDAAARIVAQEPAGLAGWILKSMAETELHRYPEAYASASEAVRVGPWSALAHASLANALRKMGRMEGAIASANKAISIAPTSTHGWDALCRVHIDTRDYANAEMSALKLLELDPQSSTGKIFLAAARTGRSGGPSKDDFELLVSELRADPRQEQVRAFLLLLAKPSGAAAVPRWVIVIGVVLGLGGFMVLGWAAMVIYRWSQVPKDVRRLVWADRSARLRIMLTVLGAILAVAFFTAAIGAAFLDEAGLLD